MSSHIPPQRSAEEALTGIPQDVLQAVKELQGSFTLDRNTLKKVTEHFVLKLEKGLSERGGSIPMNVTWALGYPTGNEQGTFLTLDLGGTNLRVSQVELTAAKGKLNIITDKHELPKEIKSGSALQLWEFVVDCLQKFIAEHCQSRKPSEKLLLAFGFSFPVDQQSIRSGFLQHWTKDFSVSGVEGRDVVKQLEDAIEKKGLPVKVIALVNDTTSVLTATSYLDPEVKIGSIFSTGCNSAYMENVGSIQKLKGCGLPDDTLIIINTDYGAFDDERKVLPFTRIDAAVDKTSTRPGQSIYEKMVAGLYLGEILRWMLLELYEHHKLFNVQDVFLRQPYTIDASFLSTIEEETIDVSDLFRDKFGINLLHYERDVCRFLVELISTRAARLSACGIAAICKKKNIQSAHVGADGAVFHGYTRFRGRMAQALREILDWLEDDDPIVLEYFKDASQTGAALIAALAMERPIEKIKTYY